MSRQIVGNQSNDFLVIGRLLSNESYKRDKKEVQIEGGKIDFIRNEDGNFLLVEVKKSSKFLEASKVQLLFYLKQLKNKGMEASGEVRIPKEKKVYKVVLDDKADKYISNLIAEINEVVAADSPPPAVYSSKCRNCSYFEFCWS